MSRGLRALKEIKSKPFSWEKLKDSLDTIEKELKRLEELEKAFVALSKDDEKAKKELSKEIEKNRALEVLFKYITIGCPFGNVHYIYLNDESEMIMPKDWEIIKEVLSNE